MKEQIPVSEKGIQIENTLSMSLQNHHTKRNKLWLVLLACTGIFSSIFTFLTMFSPLYSFPALLITMTAITAFFCCFTPKQKNGSKVILTSLLLYCVVFFLQRERISNGMMYLTNTICQTIYMTDWEYFVPSAEYSEISSVTCLLGFLMFPIICMICYAVLKYQNFFLSFLVTFPFVEIGLFFGIVPNHLFAAMLGAFWFSMAAVQFASSGITQNGGKTGFLRKRNAFFPVSNMRFMLPEVTGISIFVLILLLFLGAEQAVRLSGYERPEQIKNMRTDFQNYVAYLNWTDMTLLENYGDSQEVPQNQEEIQLGELEEKIYENTPVTSVAFSQNPDSRIYLKYRTGRIYNSKNWNVLPEQNAPNQEVFATLDYYPPEFLYHTVSGQSIIQMSLYHTNGILTQCVPYGFQKNKDILCTTDEIISTQTSHYTIMSGQDYETIFMNPDSVREIMTDELLSSCEASAVPVLSELVQNPESVWISSNSQLKTQYLGGAFSAKAAEAGILCGSTYDDFVYDYDTTVPQTPSLMAVRNRYADVLEGFDARNATPSETILRLQEIRDRICNDVTYSLSPGKTPADRDHTAYFLLENHKGYCEHYATAGTILARMAGIPARYCEGYMIDCSRAGTLSESTIDGKTAYISEILDSNAHAWAEIYLNGIGWIPFEFTFSYFTSPVSAPETVAATGTHEPVQSSTVTFTEPATLPTETTPAQPEPLPQTGPPSTRMMICITVLFLAAGCCVMALIFRITRLLILRKRETLLNQEDRNAAAQYAYQYLTRLMQECGVKTNPNTIGELVENAEEHCAVYLHGYSISAAVQLGAKLRYSPHPTTRSEFLYLCRTAQALADGMYQQATFFRKLWLKWFRHYV